MAKPLSEYQEQQQANRRLLKKYWNKSGAKYQDFSDEKNKERIRIMKKHGSYQYQKSLADQQNKKK